jgi:hypothetical protein
MGELGVVNTIHAGERKGPRNRKEVHVKAGSRDRCVILARIHRDFGKGLVSMRVECRLKKDVTAKWTFLLNFIALRNLAN